MSDKINQQEKDEATMTPCNHRRDATTDFAEHVVKHSLGNVGLEVVLWLICSGVVCACDPHKKLVCQATCDFQPISSLQVRVRFIWL